MNKVKKKYLDGILRLGLISIMTTIVFPVTAVFAQNARPDFSGVWTMYSEPGANPVGSAPSSELPFTDEGRRLRDKYLQLIRAPSGDLGVGVVNDNPSAFCVTYGMPTMMMNIGAYPVEFIQRPEQLTIIYEVQGETRRVFLQDTALPEERRFPNRQGYSSGRWEGDTLVVETTSLTDGQDQSRHPHSNQARITERISMEILENGTKVMTYEMTMTDPIYYTQPVTETRKWTPLPNGQLLPYHCSEEPWLKLLELRRAQLEAGEAVTATIADVHATKMYE